MNAIIQFDRTIRQPANPGWLKNNKEQAFLKVECAGTAGAPPESRRRPGAPPGPQIVTRTCATHRRPHRRVDEMLSSTFHLVMVSGSGPRHLYQEGDFWIAWGVDKSGHLHIAARRNENYGRVTYLLVVEIETTVTRELQNEGTGQ